MFTRNFYSLIKSVPQSTTVVQGAPACTDVYGMQYFLAGQFSFPRDRTATCTLDKNATGISFGSGTSVMNQSDYQLENTITSGLSATVTATTVDANGGEPYLQYAITVTNTSSETIAISEIGYKQTLVGCRTLVDTSSENIVALLDRTNIEPAVTLPPGAAVVIDYRLGTGGEERYVNGVKMVSWQFGSDEDVAAMIDAAHEGTIDLHADGLWNVGDMRPVQISSFAAGGVTNSEQTIDLVISSLDEYEGNGNLVQVDFAQSLSAAVRMNGVDTNTGGYGATEMYGSTLPALRAAMPEWLSSRMVEFSVPTSSGNNSSTIESVERNYLALRSEVEVRHGIGAGSKEGEGSGIKWYSTTDKMRQKRRGRTGGNNTYWFRSPYGDSSRFVYMSGTTYVSYSSANPTGTSGLAPFFLL